MKKSFILIVALSFFQLTANAISYQELNDKMLVLKPILSETLSLGSRGNAELIETEDLLIRSYKSENWNYDPTARLQIRNQEDANRIEYEKHAVQLNADMQSIIDNLSQLDPNVTPQELRDQVMPTFQNLLSLMDQTLSDGSYAYFSLLEVEKLLISSLNRICWGCSKSLAQSNIRWEQEARKNDYEKKASQLRAEMKTIKQDLFQF